MIKDDIYVVSHVFCSVGHPCIINHDYNVQKAKYLYLLRFSITEIIRLMLSFRNKYCSPLLQGQFNYLGNLRVN